MITKKFDRLPRNETETDSEYYWRIMNTLGCDGNDEELIDMLDYLWLNTDSPAEREKMNISSYR